MTWPALKLKTDSLDRLSHPSIVDSVSEVCSYVRAACKLVIRTQFNLESLAIALSEQNYIPQPTGGTGTLCSQQNFNTASRMELTKVAPLLRVNRLNTRAAQA